MAEERSYVLVPPYSIRKSRTGGILARLISRTGLDLVAARMFAPGADLVQRFAEGQINEDPDARHRSTQEIIKQYVLEKLMPSSNDSKPRVLLFVFRGPDA